MKQQKYVTKILCRQCIDILIVDVFAEDCCHRTTFDFCFEQNDSYYQTTDMCYRWVGFFSLVDRQEIT